MPAVEVHDCTPERWDDVVAVFEGPGDPGRCWCQWFHRGARIERGFADRNRDALREQVRSRPLGVLGYLDGAPSGWCAVAPRPSYTRLARSRVLAGAVDLARRGGAKVVEGYPVDFDVPVATASLYPGPLPVFLRAGFTEVCRTVQGRPVVRFTL